MNELAAELRARAEKARADARLQPFDWSRRPYLIRAEALDEAASLVDRKLELADKMVDVITTNVGQSHIDVYNTLIKLCKEYRNEPSK